MTFKESFLVFIYFIVIQNFLHLAAEVVQIFIKVLFVDFIGLSVSFGSYKGILDAVFSFIIFMIIIDRLVLKKGFKIEAGDKALKYSFFVILFLITGYVLLYDSTVAPLLSGFELPEVFKKIFAKKLSNPISGYLSIVIIAPIFEEIVFRGFILKQLLKNYNAYIAIFVSSFFFAIIHGNIQQGVNALFLGILIGLIFYKTGSLILCILAHFFNNLIAFFSYYISLIYENFIDGYHVLVLITGTFMFCLSLYLLINQSLIENKNYDSIILNKIESFFSKTNIFGIN